MKVLKTAVKIVGVVAAVAATAVTFGGAAVVGAGILGASWGAIAAGAAIASVALETLSPSKPRVGSVIGSASQWRLHPT